MIRRLSPLPNAATLAAALLPVALGAALAEAFALRLVLRMGQALPALPGLAEPFGLIAGAGVLAQNLATVAGTLTLAGLALVRMGRPGAGDRAAGALLLAALVGVTLAASGVDGPVWVTAHLLALAAMAVAAVTAPALPLRGGRAWLALPLATYAALAYHFSAPAAAAAGIQLPLTAEAYFFGEAAAVAAALALPFAVRIRLGWRAVATAGMLPLIILLALLARPWTVASLSVWTFGFTLFLPAVVYPLALGAFLAAVVALVRRGPTEKRLAVGLAFMALGGLKLDYSYLQLLALLAVATLTQPDSPEVAVRRSATPMVRVPTALGKAV